uniref:Uncharacterized protein n=1 Tax=Siphoviridae sp. ctX5W26 TaxID=2825540 RepID=A0A8S5UEP9_9CAUD|nr:MAG TPA: hypothetical protein [Siphoviridae sp. ctX5W26]
MHNFPPFSRQLNTNFYINIQLSDIVRCHPISLCTSL